ncbi:helix-turn-helix domain-containing protein [Streptomyces misionensis]|uniref:helix-turn-helix domain-containing protein n=1 Tax=Streptomyces misionensis TaxID=67331 RepID=UPI0033F2F794
MSSFGTWVRAGHAPESWDAAIIALRLTDDYAPAVDATDLGATLLLAQAYDPQHPHHDVRALAGLDTRSVDVLRTLVEADSIRSAAAALGMHPSTVQARHETLIQILGYDPRTDIGRMRYIAAALLPRLTDLAILAHFKPA